MKNKISIVTLSYNQAKHLRLCIESILSQNYDNIEYIIIDPGSTDGSRDIIMSYSDRIDKIIFEKDSGPADGLNKGFSIATGEIFGMLNADDILYKSVFPTINNLFNKHKQVDVISGDGHIIDENGKILRNYCSDRFSVKQYLYQNCTLFQQSTFFRSSIFERSKKFNTKNNISWDGELYLDFALMGANFLNVRQFWSGFRIMESTISGGDLYLSKLNKDYKRLRKIHNYPEISIMHKNLLWLINWLTQPSKIFARFLR